MKNARLGDLEVSRIGLGAMTMAGTYTSEGTLDNAESIRTIHRALDLGVTHIDTAEIYGPFLSEEIVGQAVKGRRDQVRIATKFGLVSHSGGGPGVIDSSPANVRTAVEGSLRRLGTEIGAEIGASPAQTALAWILTRGDDIAPIPGTRRVSRVEENTAADGIELTADQLERLNNLEPAAGERHNEANMASIDR